MAFATQSWEKKTSTDINNYVGYFTGKETAVNQHWTPQTTQTATDAPSHSEVSDLYCSTFPVCTNRTNRTSANEWSN